MASNKLQVSVFKLMFRVFCFYDQGSLPPNLAQDDMLRTDYQQVAFELPANFLLDAVVHV